MKTVAATSSLPLRKNDQVPEFPPPLGGLMYTQLQTVCSRRGRRRFLRFTRATLTCLARLENC